MGTRWWKLLGVVVLCIIFQAVPGQCSVIVYLDETGGLAGYENPLITDALSAVAALASPPDFVGSTFRSAIPPGTRVLDLRVEGDTTVIEFSPEILGSGELEEITLESIFEQVSATLRQFGLPGSIKMLVNGRPLSSYTAPVPVIEPRSTVAPAEAPVGGALSGRSITLSPGHGIVWQGTKWATQRGVYCAPLNEEDFHNLEICQYIEKYLTNDGMTVKVPRCTDKGYSGANPYTSDPWWKMASPYWLKLNGYPCSVYGSSTGCSLGDGVSEWDDDIRARPLASNYDNTNIYISMHTNGYQGNCYAPNYCPSGSDVYYDNGIEHRQWGQISLNLANAVNPAMISAIRDNVYSGWNNRGIHDSNGAYGEIRLPQRAAILIELGFHDSCDSDAVLLRDNFFRSAASWGIYKGICDYFGVTPTWGFYSNELVGHTIPSTMTVGESRNVTVTFRNRGVLWNSARLFRLGAVGDSDPFTTRTRHELPGEVGPNDTVTFSFTLTAPTTPGDYVTDWRMLRENVTWFGATCQQTIRVSGSDTQPPSVPTNLTATAISISQIDLAWMASTDNVGVTGYKIYRNGSYLTSVTGTSYSDNNLTHNTTYTYRVSAYDAAGNESGQSSPASAITWCIVFEDGFPNVSAWTPDTVASGSVRGLSHDTAKERGSFTGVGSAATAVGASGTEGCWSYRPFTEAFTSGRYEAWFYDSSTNDSNRQGLHLRGYNSGALAFSIYLGTFSQSPGSYTTYSGGVYNGSAWVWNGQIQTRSAGWRSFRIDVMPYTTGGIRFYIDGEMKASQDRFANLDSFGISRAYIGHNYNVNQQGWFDDARFSAPVPNAPTMGTPVALSTSSIRWPFTDNSGFESSFALHDSAHTVKQTASANASYMDETGLSPNTTYTRHIHARNGSVESPASSPATRCTLSVPPTTSTITCDRSPSTPYSTPGFNFTAVGGFGAGKVQYYRYAWNNSSTYTWSGSEPQWSSGVLSLTASSPGNWYLHVKGYNAENVENGTLTLGPYVYSPASVTISQAKAQPDGTSVSIAGRVTTANFGSFFYIEESDRSSGIRIEASGPAVGTAASVTGTMQTVDGERRISSATVQSGSPMSVPKPPLVLNRAAGGSSLNTYTPGVAGGLGTNNIGLLIATFGKVTYVGTGFCYIDDGSSLQDGSGYTGIRVSTVGITAPLAVGKRAIITGISSTAVVGGKVVPLLRPRSDSDVVLYTVP